MGRVAKLKLQYFGHITRGSAGQLALTVLEAIMEGSRHQGRPRRQRIHDIEEWTGCEGGAENASMEIVSTIRGWKTQVRKRPVQTARVEIASMENASTSRKVGKRRYNTRQRQETVTTQTHVLCQKFLAVESKHWTKPFVRVGKCETIQQWC